MSDKFYLNFLAILGAVALIGLPWILVYEARLRRKLEQVKGNAKQSEPSALTPEQLDVLRAHAAKRVEDLIKDISGKFAGDLDQTSSQINQEASRLSASVVDDELAQYRATFAQARAAAEQTLAQIQAQIAKEAGEAQGLAQATMKQQIQVWEQAFDQRVADVISTFLLQTLGREVDLGAQMDYLLAQLEKHKAELKKDILDA